MENANDSKTLTVKTDKYYCNAVENRIKIDALLLNETSRQCFK